MQIAKCAMWYIILVTAYTSFLFDATDLELGVLLQILLSFTLIFHLCFLMIGRNRSMVNLKNVLLHYFSIFAFMCLNSKPTKIRFTDTQYITESRFSN